MSRRTRFALLIATFLCLPGCQTGRGGGLFDSGDMLSSIGIGNAPSGQYEPEVALRDDDPPRKEDADF